MEFRMSLFPHESKDTWIEPILLQMKQTLEAEQPPEAPEECGWCEYRKKVASM
jgi:hypothetical protein